MSSSSTSSLDFWIRELENPTLSILPTDYLIRQDKQPKEASYSTFNDSSSSNQILDSFLLGLAVFSVLIYRLTGDDDIIILTNNPTNPASGNFILRINISSPDLSFAKFYKLVKSKYYEIINKPLDFEEYLGHLIKENDLPAPSGLFKLSFLSAPTIESEKLSSEINGSQNDLVVYFNPSSKTASFNIVYNSLLYKKERIIILSEQFQAFFKSISYHFDSIITHTNLITKSQKSLIPNPTNDLTWNNFIGCIHNIFERNASIFPHRKCVIETQSVANHNSHKNDRIFTYQQIDQASNVAAHYLIKNGIKRGDIIMIYSSRSVDLMISVLAILKAGGTFCVIDPAYPPERQTIYLDVAKPKGLIVLKKAGTLDQYVKNFINENLQLISMIPALEIADNGTLLGGVPADSSKDLFVDYQLYKSLSTNVVLGPDSNPTLAFTSGSEGIPKGVLGRHMSLAYYFPWMANQFNLSENDKFTMLSGIAHDPIQRDMFTPLFLGAQLLVPTEDDIGTPGRLAKWMQKYKATVTHLTPAMGQVLTSQALTEIPTLHHAFFVGDILTKRDCLRLQNLAHNCNIVNMYGTTETQRAVSFFEITSRSKDPNFLKNLKDIMPAGKGMYDVQVLVVNRNNTSQLAAVGEVGEIYVRASGLAECYKGLPEVNREKFVQNWFVDNNHWIEYEKAAINYDKISNQPWYQFYLGPRDRLYRSGDLGRYMVDGNVECCGRADDQIKIRGFRIELGEIDTNLSQHKLIRENKTIVKRNSDNENYLISYIVLHHDSKDLASFENQEAYSLLAAEEPNKKDDLVIKGVLVYNELIKDIKSFLKKKLAVYAIPTYIIPLDKLPLNPNGKIDKPKLPLPDSKRLLTITKYLSVANVDNDEEMTDLEKTIRDCWAEVLPDNVIQLDDSFFDIGGHSILATRMIFQVRKKLNIDLPLGTIFKHPVLKTFSNQVKQMLNDSSLNEGDESDNEVLSYSDDANNIVKTLLEKDFSRKIGPLKKGDSINVFVTGVTGFVGSYILSDLLNENRLGHNKITVFAHVRAETEVKGLERIKKACKTYGVWKDSFENSIKIVLGDLSQPHFGYKSKEKFINLVSDFDYIIHNGALVHWGYSYSKLRDSNVISTVRLLNICKIGKPKVFSFVSSTSTIDTNHYFDLSDKLIQEGKNGILESDSLSGSATGLGTGYGQSKWAAEYIVRQAGERGLTGSIIRPGYIGGDIESGCSNTDDFLLRMLKGCLQIGYFPQISNSVNYVPVNHVARIVVAATFNADKGVKVCHVTGHPRIIFEEMIGSLSHYGYEVQSVSYDSWTKHLEKSVIDENKDNALYPLLHFVLDDLPTDTKAPELDDLNTLKYLKHDSQFTGVDVSAGKGVDLKQMGIYISYLNTIGFVDSPAEKGKLPDIKLSGETINLAKSGAGSRGSAGKE
ncbi:L-aminoadipate-semialdehyde dehydrogenase [Ascoidea rubescens DSM 1968]|uniref:Alpha-aminoadipate reductase n=1 Tax=Ascoidea rubescens DSM 1968 TaxID=1344418 RepID=A0A1D2VH50_9ASCO|nr:large subunit of L-aminoadipate-semialdehyde dehydrogenase [Ascoidea rubescens DSM 1968]ODV60929.1 large subunit of L-aminoadipate-semialdehyde dehydrogenase [Ascoidea rubescens DSM 1968]